MNSSRQTGARPQKTNGPDRDTLAVEILEERIALSFTAMGANPFGLAAAGLYAHPAFVDVDGDGDQDAFIGNNSGNTFFFRNTGTNTAPAFSNVGANPFGLADVGVSAAPAFVDIDGDNLQDVFIGNQAGNTFLFLNTGARTAPAFSNMGSNPLGLANVGAFARPTFVDIDGDGDQDAFIGNGAGNTQFFLNTGTPTAPAFSNVGPNPFGLADVGSYASPTFVDIDSDGDQDAFIGNFSGNTQFFRNAGASTAPAFSNVGANPFGLANVTNSAAPTFVDIDADGDQDAFIGGTVLLTSTSIEFFQASAVIGVSGNGMTIANGQTTPSNADGTDFGATDTGTSVARTFSISNTDVVSGLFSTISITGGNPGDFSVTTTPNSPLTAGGMTTFTVTFSPTAVGMRSATISIANSDNSESPFTFSVQGVGTQPPPGATPTVTLVGGVLTATFTQNDDVGAFRGTDASITVDVNGNVFGPFAGVNHITVRALAGDDQIRILDPIRVPFQIDGGPGTDALDLSAIAPLITTEIGNVQNSTSLFKDVEVLSTGDVVFLPGADLNGEINANGGTADFSRLTTPIDAANLVLLNVGAILSPTFSSDPVVSAQPAVFASNADVARNTVTALGGAIAANDHQENSESDSSGDRRRFLGDRDAEPVVLEDGEFGLIA